MIPELISHRYIIKVLKFSHKNIYNKTNKLPLIVIKHNAFSYYITE